MRRIGIIGAMDEEVEGLKALMEDSVITRKASMDFYAGTLEGKNVAVSYTHLQIVKQISDMFQIFHDTVPVVIFGKLRVRGGQHLKLTLDQGYGIADLMRKFGQCHLKFFFLLFQC